MAAGVKDILIRFLGDTEPLAKEATKGQKILAGFNKAALVAGGVAGAAMVAGLQGAFEREDALAKLKAQAGTAPWAAAAGEAAGNLYANAYGDSMATVAEATRAVFSQGLLDEGAATAEVEAITGKVLSLAQAFDQDVSGSVNAAAQLVKTGLAKNSEEALDILTVGFQKGADKAGDLLDTFTEYGTQFRKMGLNGAQATGLLTQGLQAGARDADTVADAIKEFSIRAIDGSKTTGEGFKAIGLNAEVMGRAIGRGGDYANEALGVTLDALRAIDDPLKREAAAVALFGTKAEDLGEALYALDPTTAVDGLGKIEGAAAAADAALGQTASATLTSFKRSVQANLTDAMAKAIPYINGVAAALKPYLPLIVPIVAVLGGFAAAVWTVNVAMRAWTAATVAAAVVQRGFTAVALTSRLAFLALNAAMRANPIGAVITAITLLVGGLILAYKKSETFRNIVNALGRTVANVASTVIGWFSKMWAGLERVVAVAQEIPGKIKAAFTGAKDWLLQAGEDIMAGLAKGIGKAALAPVNAAKDAAGKVIGKVKSVFGIFSPSRVMRDLGRFTMDGLSLGIKVGGEVAAKQMDATLDKIKSKAEAKIQRARDIAGRIREAFGLDLSTQTETSADGKTTRELSIFESLQRQAEQAEAFTRQIAKLRKAGLRGGLIEQLVAGGPGNLDEATALGANVGLANSLFGRVAAAGDTLAQREAKARTGINVAAPHVDVKVEIDGKTLDARIYTVVKKRERETVGAVRAGSRRAT